MYFSEINPTPECLERFFSKINLPTISTADREELDKPISQGEILTSIKKMASGKAPGDDGFSINFYKVISSTLVDKLQRVFNEAKEKATYLTQQIPPSSRGFWNLTGTHYSVGVIAPFLSSIRTGKYMLRFLQKDWIIFYLIWSTSTKWASKNPDKLQTIWGSYFTQCIMLIHHLIQQ